MRFKGKTAVVTGGTSGIGKETALRLVKEGAEVLFTGRDESRAEQALQELEKLVRSSCSWKTHDLNLMGLP